VPCHAAIGKAGDVPRLRNDRCHEAIGCSAERRVFLDGGLLCANTAASIGTSKAAIEYLAVEGVRDFAVSALGRTIPA
jgi:hypothetical protein